jgi:uncharacterized protein (DUF885 family)
LAQEKLSTFKTVKDYENWLKRIFKQWADTAIANFDKGIAIGMVLQNIGGKMIPQLEAQTATDTLKNIL